VALRGHLQEVFPGGNKNDTLYIYQVSACLWISVTTIQHIHEDKFSPGPVSQVEDGEKNLFE
jgi:hypothetical protein